ncbi:MAG TPA: low molecular weight protein-tyrosine-phosphatase [Candidatus Desulfobacillus denitrificans]|nr:low molecular weight protein-tyrosine-phosphatase [Candidatus Desulfobacillus denitrificans]HNT62567.1 low molecular weight protein-tyrosine-phosphatase [Candidatus Desulfobacillus denitrificans]
MIRVLFVCLGNICRSPTAEGVLKKMIKDKEIESFIKVNSAGTHGYHVGEPPDPRTCEAALRRGIDLSGLRARKVLPADFEKFDLLLAMDRSNLDQLKRGSRPEHHRKLGLFMSYATRFATEEVPDPYYGGEGGFELVLDMAEDAANGLIEHLQVNQLIGR